MYFSYAQIFVNILNKYFLLKHFVWKREFKWKHLSCSLSLFQKQDFFHLPLSSILKIVNRWTAESLKEIFTTATLLTFGSELDLGDKTLRTGLGIRSFAFSLFHSKSLILMSDRERIAHVALSLTKNERFARKTDERIPNPVSAVSARLRSTDNCRISSVPGITLL